jgi:hypothetical protein
MHQNESISTAFILLDLPLQIIADSFQSWNELFFFFDFYNEFLLISNNQ